MADLTLRNRLLFASSSLGSNALTQSRGLWLVYYYAPPEGAGLPSLLPVAAVGAILFAANLVEALDDPLIGYWSDRTRSRLGRRIPFVLAATPFWALFAFLVFTPPPEAGAGATGLYLFLTLELYHLFSTLSGGPYEALLPEIATTSRERVRVVGLQVYFGALGAAVGLVGSGLLVDAVGFRTMALAMAAVALTFRYLGVAGIWHRARRTQPPAELSLRRAVRATFSNVYFLLFLPTFVLFQVGLQMLTGVLPFYVTAVLGIEEEGTMVAVLTAVALGAMLASVPVLARVAARTSKRQTYRGAMLAAALLFPLLFFAGFLPYVPKLTQMLVAMAVLGAPLAGVYLFPAALTADIVDYDAVRTGMRREATYYGAQNFVEKAATAIAPFLLALLLLLGNTGDDPLGIRLVGPAAGLAVFTGYLIFRSYDLPDEVLAKPAPAPGARRPVP